MRFIEKIKMQVAIIVFLEIVALLMLFALNMTSVAISLIVILLINTTLVIWIVYTIQNEKENRDINISKILGKEAKGAFDFGKVGIITYNDQYVATWTSDFLISRDIRVVGKKVTTFVEEINELFEGEVDTVIGHNDEYTYEITRKSEERVLFVRDITRLNNTSEKYENESLVLGLIYMDNYADLSAFEDESTITNINVNLRQPIVDWANEYGIIIRRLKSDRFLIVLNEEKYQQILADKFSILASTREKAQEIDVSITLSLAFARGHTDLSQLDDMANNLLELAQSRGGDQVATRVYGEEIKYYGGNSEKTSERSRVRVRVIASALKEIIDESNNIFISAHKDMDFDAMGACLALSRLVSTYGKVPYIVSLSGGLESHLADAMALYEEELNGRHNFINEEEAIYMAKSNDLIINVDYHNPEHSNASKLLGKINRMVVIDHHRRAKNFIYKPLLVYVESGASSSCELLSEIIAYQPLKVDINEIESTLMYTGILVDTDHFRSRCGFRTFEACAQLKKIGADVNQADNLLKENYDEFEAKSDILQKAYMYRDKMIISVSEDNKILERSIISMGANTMLDIKEVEASFVISRLNENQVGISARSKGSVNVQKIMESMQGGGHFSAAAVQLSDISCKDAENALKDAIDNYYEEEENNHESNTN